MELLPDINSVILKGTVLEIPITLHDIKPKIYHVIMEMVVVVVGVVIIIVVVIIIIIIITVVVVGVLLIVVVVVVVVVVSEILVLVVVEILVPLLVVLVSSGVPRGVWGVQTPPKFRRYRWSHRSHKQEEPASRFPFAVHCVLIRL